MATGAPVTERTGDLTDFSIKAADDEQRIIHGIATTPAVDRRGDRIDPLGASFTNPLPLLLYHDKQLPIGKVVFGTPTAAGIPFTAQLPKVADAGALRDRVELAWHSITAGLFQFVSIGYRALADAMRPNASGGFDFLKTEILELSLVTVPSNPGAAITDYKALDLAVSGRHSSAVADAPQGPRIMHTVAEQITHWTEQRQPIVTRMTEMLSPDRTLSDIEAKQYDDMAGRVAGIDEQIARLKQLERANVAAASIVSPLPPAGPAAPAIVRPQAITVRSAQVPPGVLFVRGAMCLARANGDVYQALEYAKQWRDSTPEVELWVKAAVAAGNTTDATWAGPLAVASNITAEFIALLRPKTVLGRIPGLREVPFNASVPTQTAGGTYGWVGQAKPKPVTKLGFGATNLAITKAAGIIILTQELVKLSNPSAEKLCRDDMIAGIAAFLDQQFLDPAVAAVATVNPASITNGIAPIATTNDAFKDLHAIISAFAASNVPLADLTIVMSETNAFTLGWSRDANGNRRFPGVGINGGNVDGLNIVTSNTANGWVVGLSPSMILLADDGEVTIDVSREATVQMDSAPMSPADATTVYRSLWQENLVGLRAERFINWQRASVNAVHWVNAASYQPLPASVEPTAQRRGNGPAAS